MTRRVANSWVLTIGVGALLAAIPFGLVRVRIVFAVSLLLAVCSALLARRRDSPASRLGVLAGIGTACGVSGFAAVQLGDTWHHWAASIVPLLLAFAWTRIWIDSPDSLAERQETSPTHGAWIAVAALGALVFFGGELVFSSEYPRVIDETWYLVQSRLLATGHLTGAYPVGQERLFGVDQGVFRDGRFFSQYPLGWPALLSLPALIGVERFVGPIAALVASVGAALLAHREAGGRAAMLAVLFTVCSPVFALSSWTYFSQTACAAMVVIAVLGIERGETARGYHAIGWMTLAGFGAGILFAMRPLTAVALGAITLLRLLGPWREVPLRARLASACALGIGFAAPAALTLLGNAALHGSWTTFGYQAANGPLHDLGFGQRGFISRAADGSVVVRATQFTAWRGLSQTVSGLTDVLSRFLPVAVVLPLLVLVRGAGVTRSLKWWGGTVLAVVAIHGLWFWRNPRFFIDVIPLVGAMAGVLVARQGRMAPQWRAVALQIAVIGACVVTAAGVVDRRWSQSVHHSFQSILSLPRPSGRTVLSVGSAGDGSAALEALFLLNSPRYAGRFVVVRDIGLPSDSLRALIPADQYYRVYCDPCRAHALALYPPPRLVRF